jgi:hypothetical protein
MAILRTIAHSPEDNLGTRAIAVQPPLEMKKAVASKKTDWEAECERTRQRCNKRTEDERRVLREKALRLIYSSHAETPARSR